MHIIFTEQELNWIDTKKWGWQIKKDCPPDIRRGIEKKKIKLDSQGERGDNNGSRIL